MPKRQWPLVRPRPALELVDSARRSRDPDLAADILIRAAFELKQGNALDPAIAAYVADSLLACVQCPEKAGRLLGLVGEKRGRPQTVNRELRANEDLILAALVALHNGRTPKVPLRPNGKVKGAFDLAAEKMRVSTSRVEQAWKKYKSDGRRLLAAVKGKKSSN